MARQWPQPRGKSALICEARMGSDPVRIVRGLEACCTKKLWLCTDFEKIKSVLQIFCKSQIMYVFD